MNTPLKLLLGLLFAGVLGVTAYVVLNGDPAPVATPGASSETGDPDGGAKAAPLAAGGNQREAAENKKEEPKRIETNSKVFGAECKQGVKGRLVNIHGNPIAGAEVFLMPGLGLQVMKMWQQHREGVVFPPVAQAQSEADGTFLLGVQKWEEGKQYEIRVKHPEFCDHRLPNVEPQPEDWWDVGDVKMKKGVTIFGRVTTETGLPVANASVSVLDASGQLNITPTPGREKGFVALTDAGGNYELPNIDPIGIFAMSAVAENYAKEERSELQLTGSDRHKIDFKLGPGLDIAGTVVNPAGNPVKGAKVTVAALSQKSRLMEETSTDEDGYFIVSGIKAGPYSVSVEAQGFTRLDEKPIQAGRKDLELTLETQGRVYVTVLGSNDRPIRDYHVNLKAAFEGQETYGNAVISKPVRKAKDGTVLIEGINPMTYVAEVYAPRYAKNFSERFTITEGQNEPPRITVRMNMGGRIRGRILDSQGKPVAGVDVLTRPHGMIDNPFLNIFQVPYTITKRQGKTNKDGRFDFKLLNPGQYQLKLSHRDYCTTYLKDVVVELNQTAEYNNVKMTRGCLVSGFTKVDGAPTGQVKVSISRVTDPRNPTPFSAEAVSDNEGKFVLTKRLMPGKYEVMAAEQVQANPLLMMVQFSKSKQEIIIPSGTEHQVINVNVLKLDK